MQELWLYDCGLERVPESIANLTNLQKLWLDHNNITSIPKELSLLVNLKVRLLYEVLMPLIVVSCLILNHCHNPRDICAFVYSFMD